MAEVVPPGPPGEGRKWLGSMVDGMEIEGDIISPVIEPALPAYPPARVTTRWQGS